MELTGWNGNLKIGRESLYDLRQAKLVFWYPEND
jgi:hypothetical protein